MQDTSRHWGTLSDVNKSIAGKLVYGSLNIPLFLSLFEVLMTYTHPEHHISLQNALLLSVKVTWPIYFHLRNVTYLAPRYNHRLKPRLWPVATHRRHATLVNKLLYFTWSDLMFGTYILCHIIIIVLLWCKTMYRFTLFGTRELMGARWWLTARSFPLLRLTGYGSVMGKRLTGYTF